MRLEVALLFIYALQVVSWSADPTAFGGWVVVVPSLLHLLCVATVSLLSCCRRSPTVMNTAEPPMQVSLEEFLALPHGMAAFRDFLRAELSLENLLLFTSVEQLKASLQLMCASDLSEDEQQHALLMANREARIIYTEYISRSATMQANLPAIIADPIHELFTHSRRPSRIEANWFQVTVLVFCMCCVPGDPR